MRLLRSGILHVLFDSGVEGNLLSVWSGVTGSVQAHNVWYCNGAAKEAALYALSWVSAKVSYVCQLSVADVFRRCFPTQPVAKVCHSVFAFHFLKSSCFLAAHVAG